MKNIKTCTSKKCRDIDNALTKHYNATVNRCPIPGMKSDHFYDNDIEIAVKNAFEACDPGKIIDILGEDCNKVQCGPYTLTMRVLLTGTDNIEVIEFDTLAKRDAFINKLLRNEDAPLVILWVHIIDTKRNGDVIGFWNLMTYISKEK